MRLNKFIAQSSDLSRRAADQAIADGRVQMNKQSVLVGQIVSTGDIVTLDGKLLTPEINFQTIMLNKPPGYVVSRRGQGSKTIYELLPTSLQQLQPIGRLDKDSSGLLLLTNDGELANQLTHPKYAKRKIYLVTLQSRLQPFHQQMISDHGINLADGLSTFMVTSIDESNETSNQVASYRVEMHEGRNRQIRRTFDALGYKVVMLHRLAFGDYQLNNLASGEWQAV